MGRSVAGTVAAVTGCEDNRASAGAPAQSADEARKPYERNDPEPTA